MGSARRGAEPTPSIPAAASTAVSDIGDIVTEAFGKFGSICGRVAAGPAVSEIVVYLAHEGAIRAGISGAAADSYLNGLCPGLEGVVVLTSPGQAACVGR